MMTTYFLSKHQCPASYVRSDSHVFCGYLKLPEDAARVSVIVLPQRDVLNSTLVFSQVPLHMSEEPGFKVQADPINLLTE